MNIEDIKIGDFIIAAEDRAVFAVIAKREKPKGIEITVVSGDDTFTDKRTTGQLAEIPESWEVVTGDVLFERLAKVSA